MRGGMRLISSTSRKSVKTGPGTEDHLRARGLQDAGAEDVGGHQIRSCLDAAELQAEHAAEQLNQQRLRDAGHAFNERVAAAEYGDQGLVDQLGLSGDDLADLRAAMCEQLCRGRNGGRQFTRCGVGWHRLWDCDPTGPRSCVEYVLDSACRVISS